MKTPCLAVLLAILLTPLPILSHSNHPIVATSRDGSAALVFLCDEGTYKILLTLAPASRPWTRAGLRPTHAWNLIRWHFQEGPDYDTGWYIAAGLADAWLRPSAARWTQAAALLQARGKPLVMTLYPPSAPPRSRRLVFDLSDPPVIPLAWALSKVCSYPR